MKTISNKRYCEECAVVRQQEADNYKKLCTYIYENLNGKDTCDMGVLTNNIRMMKRRFGFTDSQIYFTLVYMYEYEEDNPPPPFENENSLLTILRYYSSAKAFWRSYKQLRVKKNEIEQALTLPQNVITIKRSDLIKQEEEDRRKRYIREHRTEISVDDIVDDGAVSMDDSDDFDSLFIKPDQEYYTENIDHLRKDVMEITVDDILADID